MGRPGNPNPHYGPHYPVLHNGDLFLGFNSFTPPHQIKHTAFAHAYAQVYVYCPCPSLSLFLWAPFSWYEALVIRCPWFFVCSIVLQYKGGLSDPTSPFILFITPFTLFTSLFIMSYFHLLLIISCYDEECM